MYVVGGLVVVMAFWWGGVEGEWEALASHMSSMHAAIGVGMLDGGSVLGDVCRDY